MKKGTILQYIANDHYWHSLTQYGLYVAQKDGFTPWPMDVAILCDAGIERVYSLSHFKIIMTP